MNAPAGVGGPHRSACYNQRPRIARLARAVAFPPTVGVAQLAEHRTVAPDVVGSIPIAHPSFQPLPTTLAGLPDLPSPLRFGLLV